jgi:hypothetical protein
MPSESFFDDRALTTEDVNTEGEQRHGDDGAGLPGSSTTDRGVHRVR